MKHLTMLVYTLLLEEPQTGYSLVKRIEERTGWKPSWGSIYPLLEDLQQKKILTVKEKGRSKIYSLSKKGAKEAEAHLQEAKKILGEIIERMKILQELMHEDMSMPISYLTQIKNTGSNPFGKIEQTSLNLRKQLQRIWNEDLITTHAAKINTILTRTTQELRKIK